MKSESRVKLFALDPDAQVRFFTKKHVILFYVDPFEIKNPDRNFPFLFLKKLDFSGIEPEVKPFEEKFGKKILVKCNDLSFNLQSCVAENEEGPTTNVNNSPNYFFYYDNKCLNIVLALFLMAGIPCCD